MDCDNFAMCPTPSGIEAVRTMLPQPGTGRRSSAQRLPASKRFARVATRRRPSCPRRCAQRLPASKRFALRALWGSFPHLPVVPNAFRHRSGSHLQYDSNDSYSLSWCPTPSGIEAVRTKPRLQGAVRLQRVPNAFRHRSGSHLSSDTSSCPFSSKCPTPSGIEAVRTGRALRVGV